MTVVYVSIGSNIQRHQSIEFAIAELGKISKILKISTIYECPAIGFDGKNFFNLIVEMETSLKIDSFLILLKKIERDGGRRPDARKYQNRTLDLDIILFGDEVHTDTHKVPREDIYRYPFVIQPLFELCPELIVPNDGRSIRQIWQAADQLNVLTAVEPWFNDNN